MDVDRPAISAPRNPRVSPVQRVAESGMPRLGLAGLLFVIPVAALLGFGYGEPESSLRALSPVTTFALPVVAVVAFWWNDWPGSRLRPGWSGLTDTLLVVAAGIALTPLGRLCLTGEVPRTVFALSDFPSSMPLAGAVFVAMLQLTLVCERWPLDRLPTIASGVLALALCWLVGLVLVWTLVRSASPWRSWGGLVGGGDFGAFLVTVGVWQTMSFVVLRGRPFSDISRRTLRRCVANVSVLGGALLSYVLLAGPIGLSAPTIGAVDGCLVAAGLLIGMVFEGWAKPRRRASVAYAASVVVTVLLGALLYGGLTAIADAFTWKRAEPAEWVSYAGLNAIGLGSILHVAIGRRWPLRHTIHTRRTPRPSPRHDPPQLSGTLPRE